MMRRDDALRLLGGSVAGLSALSPLRASAQGTTASIRVVSLLIDVGIQGYYAGDMGFFRAAGLDAELSALTNGAAITAAILAGSVDFGIASCVTLATAHERGIPLAVVAPAGAYSSRSPTAGMVVAKTSSIRKPQDCAGKTIAVSLVRNLGELAVRSWLDESGIDGKSIKLIELTYSAMDAALVAGRIDVACIEEPVLSETIARDGRLLADGYNALSRQFCEAAWFCTADYAKSHPDVVRKFADVMARTAAWANKNHAASAKIIEKYAKTSLPADVHRCYYPERLRANDFQPVIDAAAKYGVLKTAFPAAELFVQ